MDILTKKMYLQQIQMLQFTIGMFHSVYRMSHQEKKQTIFCRFKAPLLSLKFYSIAILKEILFDGHFDQKNVLAIDPKASIYYRDVPWCSQNVSPSEIKPNFLHVYGPLTQFEVLQYSNSKENLNSRVSWPKNVLAIGPNVSIYHRNVPW